MLMIFNAGFDGLTTNHNYLYKLFLYQCIDKQVNNS